MTKKRIWLSLFGMAISAFGVTSQVVAQDAKILPVPEPKSPYVIKNKDLENVLPKQALDWLDVVKRNNPELNCPQTAIGASCLFLGSVSIDEENGQYFITLKGSSFIDGYINLPSIVRVSSQEENSKVWFKKVLVNNKETEIIERNGQLMAGLDKGDFDLKIIISKSYSKDISSITMENTPLILVNNIKDKNFIKDGNTIRLADKAIATENTSGNLTKSSNQEELQVNVFRKIHTQIPNVLSTKIKIVYSGKPKDFNLGKILPEGFEFNSANSNLKIEKKDDGFWVKLVSGESYLNIESFLLKNVSNIKTNGLVNSAETEVWSLQQEAHIRQVEVTSNTQVDPKQAMVPPEWNSLPAYLVKGDFNIKDNRRGLEENKNIDISFNRTSFFGFNKDEMFHLDQLNVKNYGMQFLNKNGVSVLPESFKINEQNQILLSSEQKQGVIIPKGDFRATTQTITKDSTIPVQFWEGKNEITQWVVNLAPRMKMFAITGDSIKSHGTWLDNWNLYVVFSVFLIVLAFHKLFGKTTAIMAFIGLMLFQDQIFSWALWLTILFVLGLQKVLPNQAESKLARLVNATGFAALGLFVFYTINFIKTEVQLMINPSLELIASSLNIINPSNYIIHLIFLSFFVYLVNFKDSKTGIPTISFKLFLKLTVCGFTALVILIMFAPSKKEEAVPASAIVATVPAMAPPPAVIEESKSFVPNQMDANNIASESPLDQLDQSIRKQKEQEVAERGTRTNLSSTYRYNDKVTLVNTSVMETIVLKKAQVGSGIPAWSQYANNRYTIESSEAIKNDSQVRFWIAPIWLVNILSIIQIAFLLMSLFLFTIGVLHLSNKEDWFNKIPYSIRRNKLVQILLINDLKKGFSK